VQLLPVPPHAAHFWLAHSPLQHSAKAWHVVPPGLQLPPVLVDAGFPLLTVVLVPLLPPMPPLVAATTTWPPPLGSTPPPEVPPSGFVVMPLLHAPLATTTRARRTDNVVRKAGLFMRTSFEAWQASAAAIRRRRRRELAATHPCPASVGSR
jgi:hypothetical protein